MICIGIGLYSKYGYNVRRLKQEGNLMSKLLEKNETTLLSKKDWEFFYDTLVRHPKPNKKLKEAFKSYQKSGQNRSERRTFR